jgi:hypothetical protein
MSTMLDPCATADCGEPTIALLGASPFTALRPHFGMLLGVDDFELLDTNPRGKLRLHNAWLHGEGAVWGLALGVDLEAGEVEVYPGLALDAAGRELYLSGKVCLSLPKWLVEHAAELGGDAAAEERPFLGHVVIRSRPCLSRAVPAFADPCDGADAATAYSRVDETVEVLLRAGPAPTSSEPYHRLRLFFGLDAPVLDEAGDPVAEDAEVLDRLRGITERPLPERHLEALVAFRDFAALDTIDRRPGDLPDEDGDLLFPADDDCELVLGEIRANIQASGDSIVIREAWVDVTDRPSHVATRTIQELLVGSFHAPTEAGGPRIDPDGVSVQGDTIRMPVTREIEPTSTGPNSVSISTFAGGWQASTVDDVTFDAAAMELVVKVSPAPAGDLIRVLARGTGPTPLLGTDLIPLAGVTGGPPGSPHDGHDAVIMVRS